MDRLIMLSWNIRGIGNDIAKSNLKCLLREVKPTNLLIQEQKLKDGLILIWSLCGTQIVTDGVLKMPWDYLEGS